MFPLTVRAPPALANSPVLPASVTGPVHVLLPVQEARRRGCPHAVAGERDAVADIQIARNRL